MTLRPTTLRGAALKAALLLDVIQDEEGENLFGDDSREEILPALVADLRRLADAKHLAGDAA